MMAAQMFSFSIILSAFVSADMGEDPVQMDTSVRLMGRMVPQER